jgi:hypothetical protein
MSTCGTEGVCEGGYSGGSGPPPQSRRPPPDPDKGERILPSNSSPHVAPLMSWPRFTVPKTVTTKRSMELFCILSTARDSPTSAHAQRPSKSQATGASHGPGVWRDILDPGRDPDVAEGQYYTTVVLLSMDSMATRAEATQAGNSPRPLSALGRSRPPSPLVDPALHDPALGAW